MRGFALILALTAVVLAAGACAWAQAPEAPKTSGLTSVTVTSGTILSSMNDTVFGAANPVDVTGLRYLDFTLTNNTSFGTWQFNGSPVNTWAVLVDKLEVDPSLAFPGPKYVKAAPPNWTWTSNHFEMYADTPSDKYASPPSAGPDNINNPLSGFRYYYDASTSLDLSKLGFQTHVLAVTNNIINGKYQAYTVSPLGTCGNQSTWWDAPGSGRNNYPVPEASALLLGAMGLLGPAGYVLGRRRKG